MSFKATDPCLHDLLLEATFKELQNDIDATIDKRINLTVAELIDNHPDVEAVAIKVTRPAP